MRSRIGVARRFLETPVVRRGIEIALIGGLAASLLTLPTEAGAQETAAARTEAVKTTAPNDVWGLTTEEYARYEELMKGPRGSLSDPNISPIEVLGIEARNAAERERYADLYAAMMLNETEKALQFTHAAHEAFQRRVGNATTINVDEINRQRLQADSRYPELVAASVRRSRLMVFVRLDCDACSGDVGRALTAARSARYEGADIYLLGASGADRSRIEAWAREHGLDAEEIRRRKITLNVDNGEKQVVSARMKRSLPGPIAVVDRRGDQYGPAEGVLR